MNGFADVLLPARATLGVLGSLALLLTLSVPFVWMFSMSLLLARTPSFPYGEQALFSLAFGGALVLLALVARRGRGAAISTRSRDVLVGVLLAAASLALPFFPRFSPVACVAVFAVAGVSLAWAVLRCFELTCYVDELDGPAAVLVPFALGALIRFAFMSVPLAYALRRSCLSPSPPRCPCWASGILGVAWAVRVWMPDRGAAGERPALRVRPSRLGFPCVCLSSNLGCAPWFSAFSREALAWLGAAPTAPSTIWPAPPSRSCSCSCSRRKGVGDEQHGPQARLSGAALPAGGFRVRR